ncbi:MAG: zinc-ribbon domain-containing protein [Chitinophagaceae bacterium]
MIVYGTRSTELEKELVSEKCANCGTQHSILLHVFQKYAHIFWIPFFPIGKTAVSQCGNCKQVLNLKQMPASLSAACENIKPRSKTPIWMFSGLALLAAIIVAAGIGNHQQTKRNTALILTPKSGDIFEVKTKEHQYTLYKVTAMQGDSALIQINQYETNKESGLSDLKRKGATAYSAEIYAFSRAELNQMFKDGEIIDIDRE